MVILILLVALAWIDRLGGAAFGADRRTPDFSLIM